MAPSSSELAQLYKSVLYHLETIYQDELSKESINTTLEEIIRIMRLDTHYQATTPYQNNWDENDIILITYGNSVQHKGEAPLKTLHKFLNKNVKETINSIHILPFFPYCSDDGFAVKDYYQVDPLLGDWADIEKLTDEYRVMAT